MHHTPALPCRRVGPVPHYPVSHYDKRAGPPMFRSRAAKAPSAALAGYKPIPKLARPPPIIGANRQQSEDRKKARLAEPAGKFGTRPACVRGVLRKPTCAEPRVGGNVPYLFSVTPPLIQTAVNRYILATASISNMTRTEGARWRDEWRPGPSNRRSRPIREIHWKGCLVRLDSTAAGI